MVSMLVIADLVGEFGVTHWRRSVDAAPAEDLPYRPGDRSTIEVAALPGHDEAPQPLGGEYDLVTAGYTMADRLADDPERVWDIIVGVGVSGWAASVAALGGHARRLVLIDGLGDPWLTTPERAERRRRRMRSIEADPAALAAHTGGGRDPRLAHGIEGLGSRRLAIRTGSATTVPTLIVTTGGRTPDAGVVAAYPSATERRAASAEPAGLLPLIGEWWTSGQFGGN